MPVAFLRRRPSRLYAPVAGLEVRLGADRSCGIVDRGAGVAALHARLHHAHGQWVLTAEAGCGLEVNEAACPSVVLDHGDCVRLGDSDALWSFRDRLAGRPVRPGATLADAWSRHPAYAAGRHGPDRLGIGRGVAGRDPERCARVQVDGAGWVVKRLPPGREAGDADRHLRLLAALGGAPHRAVARLLDGGLVPAPGGAGRWLATGWVEGAVARDLVADGGITPGRVAGIVRTLAAGLAHLHARGVVHRDVAPGNVIVTEDGGAVLIDYGQALLADEPRRPSAGVVGTPGFVAPEEVLAGVAAAARPVDVYGLGAVGYALLTGGPPAFGGDVLAALSRAACPPIPPRELGVDVPEPLEAALLHALAPDPGDRPTAVEIEAALAAAEAAARLGGIA